MGEAPNKGDIVYVYCEKRAERVAINIFHCCKVVSCGRKYIRVVPVETNVTMLNINRAKFLKNVWWSRGVPNEFEIGAADYTCFLSMDDFEHEIARRDYVTTSIF